jgi:hypothetical protein
MQDIDYYLNEKLKEKIPKYKIKSKSAFEKWVQNKSDSNTKKVTIRSSTSSRQ